MRRIINSWATIRPRMFISTYRQWYNNSDNKDFITYVGCNTVDEEREFELLTEDYPNVIVIALGSDIKGVPTANYRLLQSYAIDDSDIIVVGADDFNCPKHWDSIIRDIYSRYDGCVIFEDGNPQRFRPIITIPVLSGRLLKKLNKIIYHPSYSHNYADNEFFLNVSELGEVVDLRYAKPDIIFEHRHWLYGKRSRDIVDRFAIEKENEDHINWDRRRLLSIEERLKV